LKTATQSRPVIAILLGGGIAATLDITYAIMRHAGFSRSPLWVLQLVASGWLGNGAFESGVAAGALGLVSHFFILFVAAAFYLAASRRLSVLRSQALLCGAVFGVLVYVTMNFVVLPLSAFPFHPTYPPLKLLEGFVSHAVLIGMPIALAVKWWGGANSDAQANGP